MSEGTQNTNQKQAEEKPDKRDLLISALTALVPLTDKKYRDIIPKDADDVELSLFGACILLGVSTDSLMDSVKTPKETLNEYIIDIAKNHDPEIKKVENAIQSSKDVLGQVEELKEKLDNTVRESFEEQKAAAVRECDALNARIKSLQNYIEEIKTLNTERVTELKDTNEALKKENDGLKKKVSYAAANASDSKNAALGSSDAKTKKGLLGFRRRKKKQQKIENFFDAITNNDYLSDEQRAFLFEQARAGCDLDVLAQVSLKSGCSIEEMAFFIEKYQE